PLNREGWHDLHDVWEVRWRDCVPESASWYALRGLIQLSAAGVKVCDGNWAGVDKLLARATANLSEAIADQAFDELAAPKQMIHTTPIDSEAVARTLLLALERLESVCSSRGLS
ncbi:MAG: DUF309 domain-containing protein, partial [Candidatus Dadabacteria bacterium]